MADFNSIEEKDGLRLSWNIWPNSKIEATKCVLPFGALYTPLKDLPNMPVSNPSSSWQTVRLPVCSFVAYRQPLHPYTSWLYLTSTATGHACLPEGVECQKQSKVDQPRAAAKLPALIQPLLAVPWLRNCTAKQVVNYEPVQCKGCGGILNPYAQVDFAGRVWLCPMCHMRNGMPAHYHGISEQVRLPH